MSGSDWIAMRRRILAAIGIVLFNTAFVLIAAKVISGEWIPNGAFVVITVLMLSVSCWGIPSFFAK
jgi:hypothetical protein